MRFGDRLNVIPRNAAEQRWCRYCAYLQSLRLSVKSDLYRYFGGDVFHDSEIGSVSLDIASSKVSLALVNVYALDFVANNIGFPAREKIEREDFITAIQFNSVQLFRFKGLPAARKLYYYSAKIDKKGSAWELEIQLTKDYSGPQIPIHIRFGQVVVQNIGKTVSKYLRGAPIPPDLLSPCVKPPGHYIKQHCAHRRGRNAVQQTT